MLNGKGFQYTQQNNQHHSMQPLVKVEHSAFPHVIQTIECSQLSGKKIRKASKNCYTTKLRKKRNRINHHRPPFQSSTPEDHNASYESSHPYSMAATASDGGIARKRA